MDSISIDMDLYGLIGVAETASEQEIKKAYRKKALSCHPDKNPDNPRAAELFHDLSHALEILTDSSARAAYDKVISARRRVKRNLREVDAKRKKLKEDLEAREQAYEKSSKHSGQVAQNDEDKLRAEIERLRKEGSKQLQEEITRVRQQMFDELHLFHKDNNAPSGSYKVKIKWKTTHSKNSRYDYESLYRILSKYGDIIALVVSKANKGSAIVEFERKSDAEMAVNTEIGFIENPLMFRKLWSTEKDSVTNTSNLTVPKTTNVGTSVTHE